jgi:DNA polymerase elongation subunit (family B)
MQILIGKMLSEGSNMEVVYGHTDSIYVKVDSIESAFSSLEKINEEVRTIFPNLLGLEEHPVVLEFEKYFESLGVGITKNRNAGLISWEDGVWLDEPKFTLTGFTSKRISEAVMAKEVQTVALNMWVSGKSEHEIVQYAKSAYVKVLNGEIDFREVAKRTRLKKERFQVKCSCNKKYDIREISWTDGEFYCSKCAKHPSTFLTAKGKKPTISEGIVGVLYSMQERNLAFEDSYVFLRIRPSGFFTDPLSGVRKEATYVSGNTFAEIEGFEPDWPHYAEQVVSKVQPIFDAMGWDTKQIKIQQRNFDEWW